MQPVAVAASNTFDPLVQVNGAARAVSVSEGAVGVEHRSSHRSDRWSVCAFVGSNRSLATPEIGGGEVVALRAKGVRFEEYDNRRVPNCEWDRDERNCDDRVWFRDTKGNLAAIVQPVTRWATQTDLSVVRAHPPRDASWRSRFSVRAG